MQTKDVSTNPAETHVGEGTATERPQETSNSVSSSLRQALPCLRDIVLTATLTGPVLFEGIVPDSFRHGGGWSG